MYKCNYCNRHLKKKYDKCPGCGSNDFTKIQNYGEIVIKEPPKGGYKVDLRNFKHKRKEHRGPFLIGVYMIIMVVFFGSICIFVPGISALNSDFGLFPVIFIIFGVIFIGAGIYNSREIFSMSKDTRNRVDRSIKKVRYLSEHGMLIKNLKYKVKPVNGKINNQKTIYRIQVIYEIEKGKTMCFESEPKYLSALGRDDGTVDLLIDPNDYSNYFIDFEIY